MKKNFVKKLSVALALAMTVSTLAPAANADAAAAPAFSSYKTSVYENGTNNGSYTYTVKNIKKGYTVKWSVTGDAKDYVKVSKASTKATKTTVSNKITVKTNGEAAAKNAKATVTAKVYDTKNKLVKTVKDAVTVKVQATGVSVATKEATLTTAVGASLDFDRTLTPANSTSKTYYSVDGTDATITSAGVFTATKAGEYTVTATVKNSKTAKTLATTEAKVVVKDVVLKSVAQESVTTLTAVVAGDASKLKASDIVITRNSDNVVFPVSTVTVDKKDATKVTLTVFSKINDGKEYTLKYADSTFNFTATDGKAVSLVIDPVTVPFNTETEIHVLGKDAKGVTVFDSMMSTKDSKLDINVETTQGYMTGDKLVLLEKGNTAKVTATLHTYEYNADGTEKNVIKTEATITAVDPEVISLANTKYTVAKTLDWTKAANTKIAVGEDDRFVFFQLKNNKDKDVTADYTKVESSDTNTLLVAYTAAGKAALIPVKEGTAYVLVKDSKDNVIASFAVTVVAKREAASIELDPASVTVSNALVDKATTKLTVKDQYGDKMANPADGAVTITKKSSPEIAATKTALDDPTYTAGKITTTTATTTQKGTYVYEVKYLDKFVRMLTVTVQEVANSSITSTFKVALDTNKVDTTITTDYDGSDIEINVTVGEYKGNVKVADTAVSEVKVFNAKGEAVTSAAISGSKIIAAKNNVGTIDKYLEAGSYTAKVKFNDGTKDIVATTGFVVEDTQPGVTYTVKKNSVEETNISAAVQNKDNVVFYYNGEEIPGTDVTYVSAKNISSEKTYAGIKVTVMVTVATYKVPVTITLNQAITVK